MPTVCCRLCLAMDVPMHVLENGPLQEIYEKLTNVLLNKVHLPVVACYLCYSQLRKCHNLMARSVRADKVLTQILQSRDVENGESIAMINREAHQLNNTLVLTPVEIFAFSGTNDDIIKEEIKSEPQEEIEEMDTVTPSFRERLKYEVLDYGEHIARTTTRDDDVKMEELTEREGPVPTKKYKQTHRKIQNTALTSDKKGVLELIKIEIIIGDEVNENNDLNMLPAVNTGNKSVSKDTNTEINNGGKVYSEPVAAGNSDYISTNTDVDTSNKHSKNMLICKDCGDVFWDDYSLIEHKEFHNALLRNSNDKNSKQGNAPSVSETGIVEEHAETNTVFWDDNSLIEHKEFHNALLRNSNVKSSKQGNAPSVSETGILEEHAETNTDIDNSSKHSKNMLICKDCGDVFWNDYSLIEHKELHNAVRNNNDKSSQQDNVPLVSETGIVEEHAKTNTDVDNSSKHSKNMLICKDCGDVFWNDYSLIEHKELHNAVRNNNDRSSKQGNAPSVSETGILEEHAEVRIGNNSCEYKVRERHHTKNLSQNLIVHTEEKRFECEICHRRFSKMSHLMPHLRVHTGEKPFECDICHRRYMHKNVLLRHSRVHTEEKPFECEICQHRFSEKSNLLRHLRVHTEEKPFKCEICQHRFSQKSNLLQHSKVHTEEKPFECEICYRRFKLKSILTRHLKVHTKGGKSFQYVNEDLINK